jgi:methionine synthase I (cobalamin-dependent)
LRRTRAAFGSYPGAGANISRIIVDGCCGTDHRHIAAIAQACLEAA